MEEKLCRTILTIDEDTEALLFTESQKRLLIYLHTNGYLSEDLIISYDIKECKTV